MAAIIILPIFAQQKNKISLHKNYMYQQLDSDLAMMDALLQKAKDLGTNFLKNIDTVSTSSVHTIAGNKKLSAEGMGAMQVLLTFQEQYEPLIVSSTGPRYWGFVTGGATPASIIGDWLASVYDQNTQALKGYGDLSAQIEFETIYLLLQLFHLPHDYLGGFVTGATMSNFTCLAVARQWAGKQLQKDIAKDGMIENITILTATPHSSAVKSLALLGIGSRQFIKIKAMEGNREAMDMADLEENIKALSGSPFILISSAGTVNTVDFDNFSAIADLQRQYNFWWHIDAAFGGFAACSPLYKHLVKGWEMADSITIDCHKWLNVPYDNAFFLIKEKHRQLQVETFQNSNAPYLGDPLENFSYLNFLPENSRRLRALPVWFTLMAYGKDGYRAIVENSVSMARRFGDFIQQHSSFELLAPVRLNTVCFTLVTDKEEKIVSFLQQLNDTGKVFMTATMYNGHKGIRAAFVNWRTTAADTDMVTAIMQSIIDKGTF